MKEWIAGQIFFGRKIASFIIWMVNSSQLLPKKLLPSNAPTHEYHYPLRSFDEWLMMNKLCVSMDVYI